MNICQILTSESDGTRAVRVRESIDFRRQNLTSKVGPRTERVKALITSIASLFILPSNKAWRKMNIKLSEIILVVLIQIIHNNFTHFNPYSAGIDFSRQNLMSVDVRFWHLKSIPTL